MIKFINEEKGNNRLRIKNGMIIIDCPTEEMEILVQENYQDFEE